MAVGTAEGELMGEMAEEDLAASMGEALVVGDPEVVTREEATAVTAGVSTAEVTPVVAATAAVTDTQHLHPAYNN